MKSFNNFYYNYTHCELHPAMMYGALCSNIPFCNHNQAPRNQYQAAMGKQAIGIFSTNYNQRIDTMQNILYYVDVQSKYRIMKLILQLRFIKLFVKASKTSDIAKVHLMSCQTNLGVNVL